ncbi:MAG: hypothetical protein GXP62_03155, partial [Oligoflexia bacterium]|nr:hypothetical protein [Oligoflexia bacterium]
MPSSRLLLPPVAGLLCACQAPVETAGGPTVQVGTGDTVFLGLLDGQAVEMTHGPQGGWHIMGAV